jgi:hypothetical protein
MAAEGDCLARKRSESVHVESAIRFIAEQFGGPGRVLAHHRTTGSGLCAACASVRHVRWPCTLAAMALLAEQRR